MSETALILAGHGSHISPNTGGLVWAYVDQLRRWGVADEVTAAFWKETPAFSQVLDTVVADTVTVVPVFAAEGYFSTQVVPTEIGIAGATTRKAGRTIHYTAAISEHPGLAQVVRQRLDETLSDYDLDPAQVAVAIAGHGTGRSHDSKNAAIRQAKLLHHTGLFADVLYAFLDDQPDIPSIYERAAARQIIVIPLFLASGSHVSRDVPAALGLPTGSASAEINGKLVYLTEPTGTSTREICTMILDLAHGSDARFARCSAESPWSGFPQVGAAALILAVQQAGTLPFGQLQLSVREVRPMTHSSAMDTVDSPAALRAIVRETPFRPLPTSDDLPGGWRVLLHSPEVLPAVVETIYPGALADWYRQQQGTFQPETLQAVSERQLGMFRGIHETPQLQAHVNAICGRCVRHATWFYGDSPTGTLPCEAPCNIWLSRVAEAVA